MDTYTLDYQQETDEFDLLLSLPHRISQSQNQPIYKFHPLSKYLLVSNLYESQSADVDTYIHKLAVSL